MLAKVAGWKHGVAKRSKPVIVRVQDRADPAAWLDGVKKVYDDWLPVYEANVCDVVATSKPADQLTICKTREILRLQS